MTGEQRQRMAALLRRDGHRRLTPGRAHPDDRANAEAMDALVVWLEEEPEDAQHGTQAPAWAPDRIYVQPDNDGNSPCYWSDERVTPQDVLYVRRDLAGADTPEIAQHGTNAHEGYPEYSPAPDRAATGRTGHWTGTEEAQANYLIAAMTGRTPEEVKEPLSRLLHELRYGKYKQLHLSEHWCGAFDTLRGTCTLHAGHDGQHWSNQSHEMWA